MTIEKTSASDAVLTAVTAARTRYLRHLARSSNSPSDLGPLDPAHSGTASNSDAKPTIATNLLIYTTTQTHSVGVKAGLILNLPVRALPVYAADNYALRGETLKQALEEDEKAGRSVCVLGAYVQYRALNITPILWYHINSRNYRNDEFGCGRQHKGDHRRW